MKDLFKFVVRPDNLMLVVCLCLFVGVIAHGENGPTPQVVVGSSGISDGSVTNAKLAEPVSVAKGGTGKTTAAEGLAVLGGASLNGSSTVDFTAEDLNASGFTKLGDAATGIKMKVLTGTTAAAEGGVTLLPHGLNSTKIVAWTCAVAWASGGNDSPNSNRAGHQYFCAYHSSTDFVVELSTAESENILEKPIQILVWYKE